MINKQPAHDIILVVV